VAEVVGGVADVVADSDAYVLLSVEGQMLDRRGAGVGELDRWGEGYSGVRSAIGAVTERLGPPVRFGATATHWGRERI
jgi:hypothetical protein